MKKSIKRKTIVTAARMTRILNCDQSVNPGEDWRIDEAFESGLIDEVGEIPDECDLREDWWDIRNQKRTGACVGFATADGVLRWHYVKKRWIENNEKIAPRFIWMANKETDEYNEYPTTFIEKAGTQTKSALGIARKYGAVVESILPMSGELYPESAQSFYIKAARLRITSYHNLDVNFNQWRFWLSQQGPILTRLVVDENFRRATKKSAHLKEYDDLLKYGGHAVAIVGYTTDYFIVRNSWGTRWGDKGFAFVSEDYTKAAFTEAYGVII